MFLSRLVDKVVNKQNDFCCVCFNNLQGRAISLENEFMVNINNVETNVVLYDVLLAMTDDETLNYISGFNCLCMECTQTALSSYIFLKKAKENTELLAKVMEGLSNGLPKVDCSLEEVTLFISLNTEDFSTKQYTDTKSANNVSEACKNLNCLLNDIKPEVKHLQKYKIKQRRKSKLLSKVENRIPNEKIKYDPNDTETMKCKECLKVYPTIWNLRNHYMRVHAPKIYKCPDCPIKYGSLGCLKTHQSESHCTVVCSVCGKVFHNRHTLKIHEMAHQFRIVCKSCGRIYKNKCTYNKHIENNVCGKESRASPSDAKFECDYCHKKYTQKMSLRIHIQFEHGNYKSYNCKWCEKKFWCPSRLNAHIVKHTQEKKFHCDICNRNFVTKESLLYHTRIHTGEKPYKCTQCDARFLSASRRSDHVKKHHKGGTHECDVCHGKFNSKNYLQKHKRIHLVQVEDSTELTNKIPQMTDNLVNKPFVLQSHQIPDMSTVYNYNEVYIEVPNNDYSIKLEQGHIIN